MMWRPFDTEKCKFVVILLQKGRLFGGLLAKIRGPKWSKFGSRASKRALDSCLANTLFPGKCK